MGHGSGNAVASSCLSTSLPLHISYFFFKDSTVVGFDIRDIQPDLQKLEGYNDLASRVRWVHGNLYVLNMIRGRVNLFCPQTRWSTF